MQSNERVIRYWPHGKPIPEGWVKCGSMSSAHHGHYSFLIEKLQSNEKPNEKP